MGDRSESKVINLSAAFKGLRYALIISLLISTILILYTIEIDHLREAISSVSFKMIILLMVLLLTNWLAAGVRLKVMVLTVGGNISLLEGIIIYLGGSFISNVTPSATGGGPYQIYILHKKGLTVGQGTMVIVINFILRISFFSIASSMFLLFFNKYISPGVIPSYIFYIALGVGMLITISILVLSLVPGVINYILDFLFKIQKIRTLVKKSYRIKKLLARAKRELKEFHLSLELLWKNKMRLFLVCLYTILYWSSLFMILPILLIGLGLEPYFLRSFIMQTIFNLVIPYMPTPGASGIAEIGFASLFVSFIPKGLIGLVTLVWRFIIYYLVLILGGFFALRELGWQRGKRND